jgi:hypothetical protein
MGFPLPGVGRAGRRRDEAGVLGLEVSHLSPLDRRGALPPHHPHRLLPGAAFPYSMWSTGVPRRSVPRPPDVVDLRGDLLTVRVDLSRGGRMIGVDVPGRQGWSAVVRGTADGLDVRGAGLRGGIELNVSPFRRTPWSLEPVHAAVGLPSRLGGDRLRWWEYERASQHLVQVDLHVPDGRSQLVVVARQTALVAGSDIPTPRLLIDDVGQHERRADWSVLDIDTLGVWVASASSEDGGARTVRVDPSGASGQVSWFVVSFDGAPELDDELVNEAVAGLDDPVLRSCGRMISHGPGWAALELERVSAGDGVVPFDLAATPVAALEHEELANRLRSVPEAQWLHLLRDEGLGVIDRVHPQDVGQPAGEAWTGLLTRARRRESLGDWRVHLRAGELAFLASDLGEAEERWNWSYALRPTAWVDRNLALVHLARGRADLAAVCYLRATRNQPDEVELAVEAIGALIGSGRAGDARQVLDRVLLRGYGETARYWLLEAEVALAEGRGADALTAVGSASACADGDVHEPWARRVRTAIEDVDRGDRG